jgi:hypothetical protein
MSPLLAQSGHGDRASGVDDIQSIYLNNYLNKRYSGLPTFLRMVLS